MVFSTVTQIKLFFRSIVRIIICVFCNANRCILVFFQIISRVLWVVVSPPVTSPLLSPARSDEVTAPEPEDTRMASPAASPGMLH